MDVWIAFGKTFVGRGGQDAPAVVEAHDDGGREKKARTS